MIGLFITFFVYFGIFVLNGFIFYSYIVFLHMEGRMIDLYTRVVAGKSHFFTPFDNEISARALRQVLEKVRRENNSLKGTPGMKHVAISHHEISMGNGAKIEKSSYVAIYEKRTDNRLELFRHFIRLSDGSICELEQQLAFKVDEYPLFDNGPPAPKMRSMSNASGMVQSAAGARGPDEERKQPALIPLEGMDISGTPEPILPVPEVPAENEGLIREAPREQLLMLQTPDEEKEVERPEEKPEEKGKDESASKGHNRVESFMEPAIVIVPNPEIKNES